jgi:hypothetical protein
MKKIFIVIIVLAAIFGCNQNERNADISKNKEIEKIDTIEENESIFRLMQMKVQKMTLV